ncbi:acyl-CoA dehydrogenase [Oxalobacteraceae bacterium A2-2]
MTPAAIERHLPLLSGATPPEAMRSLIGRELDRPPLPGGGATLERWRILAAVGGQDLSLFKLYEGHTDAIAILHELEGPPAPYGSLWGVWCAESPESRLELRGASLTGTKLWCSGAADASHALVSCWNEAGEPCLAAVQLDQPGVEVTDQGWHAVGMAACASVDVHFQDACARQVGAPYAYLHRAGFAHGAIGVAAGWHGAACAIAERLHRQLHDSHEDSRDALRLAQLGGVDVELSAAGALLRMAAAEIDRSPSADVNAMALRVRLAVEQAATRVLALAMRALGAGPLCRDRHFARICADLPVFLRQSHAERDLARLGKMMAALPDCGWRL